MEPTASILRINGSKILPYSFISTPSYQYILSKQFISNNSLNLETRNISKILPYRIVKISSIYDMSWIVLPNSINEEILRELGLMSVGNDPHFILSRLLLHPNQELSRVIWRTTTSNDFSTCIGLQLRMGGSIAANHESTKFLKISTLERELPKIDKAHKQNSSIFLSTDSPSLVPLVKRLLPSHTVIFSDDYEVGHTATKFSKKHHNPTVFLKRAVLDLNLLSFCNPIYYTNYSSYGQLSHQLSFNSNYHIIHN